MTCPGELATAAKVGPPDEEDSTCAPRTRLSSAETGEACGAAAAAITFFCGEAVLGTLTTSALSGSAAKSSTTNVVSLPSYIPCAVAIPICVYSGFTIFAWCAGEFIHPSSTSNESVKLMARFSPAYVYSYPTASSQY